MVRSIAGCLTLGIVSLLHFSQLTQALPKAQLPDDCPYLKVKVLVYNDAPVSPETLAQAQERAGTIYQHIGLEIVWLDRTVFKEKFENSPERQHQLDLIDVFLRLVPRSRPALKNSALGEALPCRLGKDACIANVFMNRIEERTEVERISLAEVLGHAMAHEVGHILLGSSSHASSGLMKAKWEPEDLKRAAKGDLLFTPEQAKTIRASFFCIASDSATLATLGITVRVYNYAQVAPEVLTKAEKEAESVFRRAGIIWNG